MLSLPFLTPTMQVGRIRLCRQRSLGQVLLYHTSVRATTLAQMTRHY